MKRTYESHRSDNHIMFILVADENGTISLSEEIWKNMAYNGSKRAYCNTLDPILK